MENHVDELEIWNDVLEVENHGDELLPDPHDHVLENHDVWLLEIYVKELVLFVGVEMERPVKLVRIKKRVQENNNKTNR